MTQGKFNFGNETPGDNFGRRSDFFDTSKPLVEKKTVAPKGPTVFSVTQATRLLKFVVNENMPGKMLVAGEISNYKPHGMGHLYFTLKDADTAMSAVMWKSDATKLKFTPRDGMAVVATGNIDIYEPQGKYQFYVKKLELSGSGALELALKELAAKLRIEGLFDKKHKKPIPKYPSTIAIVTSDTGAAIEDITFTLNRRWPVARKLLYAVQVQGVLAAGQIAAAIADINRREKEFGKIDVMIVGRGGGSLEDLWPFNEEIVARAIFKSRIPIISAVGHEIDNSIADFVADLRAATPTAAAELATPVLQDILQYLEQAAYRFDNSMGIKLSRYRQILDGLAQRRFFVQPADLIVNQRLSLDKKAELLYHSYNNNLHRQRQLIQRKIDIIRRIEPQRAIAQADSKLSAKANLLQLAINGCFKSQHQKMTLLEQKYQRLNPMGSISSYALQLNQLKQRLVNAQAVLLDKRSNNILNFERNLRALDPRAVLNRGYSITRNSQGQIIKTANQVAPGEIILTELAQQQKFASKVLGDR